MFTDLFMFTDMLIFIVFSFLFSCYSEEKKNGVNGKKKKKKKNTSAVSPPDQAYIMT